MALDVYFREDILNVLRATYVAGQGSGALIEALEDQDLMAVPMHKLMDIYQSGFATALGAVGLAFGLTQVVQEAAQQLAACPSLPAAARGIDQRPRAALDEQAGGGRSSSCRSANGRGWSKGGDDEHDR